MWARPRRNVERPPAHAERPDKFRKSSSDFGSHANTLRTLSDMMREQAQTFDYPEFAGKFRKILQKFCSGK